MIADTAIAIGSTTGCYKIKAISTVKMSPTKIRLFFPTAANEGISIAIYKGTSSTAMSDATLYASVVNQDIGTQAGEQEFTLTQESGAGNIEVGDGIVFVLSINGGGGGDTILGGGGLSDTGLAVSSTTQPFFETAFPSEISTIATGFSATTRRISYFLY